MKQLLVHTLTVCSSLPRQTTLHVVHVLPLCLQCRGGTGLCPPAGAHLRQPRSVAHATTGQGHPNEGVRDTGLRYPTLAISIVHNRCSVSKSMRFSLNFMYTTVTLSA